MNYLADLKGFLDNSVVRFLLNIPEETQLSGKVEPALASPLPNWLILLIAVAAVALVGLVYYKEASSAGKRSKIFMAVMRLLIIALVLIILMEPTINSIRSEEEPSTILVVIDTSKSMTYLDKSMDKEMADKLGKAINASIDDIRGMQRIDLVKKFINNPDPNAKFLERLVEKGIVKIVTFDYKINYDYKLKKPEGEKEEEDDKQKKGSEECREIVNILPAEGTETRLPYSVRAILEKAKVEYNLAAVILFTDGRTTSEDTDAQTGPGGSLAGLKAEIKKTLSDPMKADLKIYTILVGDTTPLKDLNARSIEGPRDVSKDSNIRIDVDIAQEQYEEVKAKIQLWVKDMSNPKARPYKVKDKNGEDVYEIIEFKPVNGRVQKVKTLTFNVKPEGKGSWLYTARIEDVPDDDSNKDNNVTKPGHYVDVTDRRLKVLLVEGTPRWEYRFIKNVLIRMDKEFVVWCLLLSADEGFPQEHTPGDYVDEHGNTVKIKSLESFPSAEKLNKFDVIIWGDVNPKTTVYGVTPESLEQVASWVMAGDAGARGDKIEAAVSGGGLIAILGEQYFPRAYKDLPRSSSERRTMSDILPFTIVPPSMPLEELHGDQEEPFKYKIRPEAMRSEILRFYDDPERNRRFWEKGAGEGQSQGLPGSFWFWPIERPSPTARILVEHPDKKSKDEKPYPLILEHSPGKGRVFTMAIDDTWRWRYEVGDKFFAKFWITLIKTAAESSVTQRRFSIKTDRDKYIKGKHSVIVYATVLDKQLQPIEEKQIEVIFQGGGETSEKIKITLDAKTERSGDREEMTGKYEGEIKPEQLKAGTYRIWIDEKYTSTDETKKESVSTHFSVIEVDAESANRTASAEFLTWLAATGRTGRVRTLDELGTVPGDFESPRVIKQVAPVPTAIWAAWITLFIALIVLCAEWIVRKLRRLI